MNTRSRMWSFEAVSDHRLTEASAILEVTMVQREISCGYDCMAHPDCVMFNVQQLANNDYRCELLSPVNSYSVTAEPGVNHYRPRVSTVMCCRLFSVSYFIHACTVNMENISYENQKNSSKSLFQNRLISKIPESV